MRIHPVLSGRCAAVVCAVIMLASTVPADAHPVAQPGHRSRILTSVLSAGQSLYSANQDELVSTSQAYNVDLDSEALRMLEIVPDGDTVAAATSWDSGTNRPSTAPLRLTMQTDGNLVLYRLTDGRPVWNTRTGGTGSGNSVHMQNDGNLVLYTSSGRVLWQSHSGPSLVVPGAALQAGQYLSQLEGGAWNLRFAMQTDGNLVLYQGAKALWSTRTGTPGSRAVMQTNGDLVVYSPNNTPLWHSGRYSSTGTAYLQIVGCQGPTVAVYSPETARYIWGASNPLPVC